MGLRMQPHDERFFALFQLGWLERPVESAAILVKFAAALYAPKAWAW